MTYANINASRRFSWGAKNSMKGMHEFKDYELFRYSTWWEAFYKNTLIGKANTLEECLHIVDAHYSHDKSLHSDFWEMTGPGLFRGIGEYSDFSLDFTNTNCVWGSILHPKYPRLTVANPHEAIRIAVETRDSLIKRGMWVSPIAQEKKIDPAEVTFVTNGLKSIGGIDMDAVNDSLVIWKKVSDTLLEGHNYPVTMNYNGNEWIGIVDNIVVSRSISVVVVSHNISDLLVKREREEYILRRAKEPLRNPQPNPNQFINRWLEVASNHWVRLNTPYSIWESSLYKGEWWVVKNRKPLESYGIRIAAMRAVDDLVRG